MPRYIAILFSVVLAVTLAAVILLRPHESRWTSDSGDAISALERGLEARRRYYTVDAVVHFEQALELDPDLAAAKIFLLHDTRFHKNEKWHALFEELREQSLENLTASEVFLVRYGIALLEGGRQEATEILESHLRDDPGDSFAQEVRCDRLWRGEHLEQAELCYSELLESEPNWGQAQNRLGYVAMGQGRFSEAEEHFRTYRYIAPDQANPHDSLGDLLLLLGRYEEAEAELREALSIRPDFCNSYSNLADLVLYTRDASRIEETVVQAARHCGEEFANELGCSVQFNIAFANSQWEELATSAATACVRRNPALLWMVHRGTVLVGEFRLAKRIEKAVAEIEYKVPLATQLHLKGVRLSAEGEIEGAICSFEGADGPLDYEGQSQGMLKLFNRLNWAHAYELAGDPAKAKAMIASVAEVNPDLAELYRRGEMVMPQP